MAASIVVNNLGALHLAKRELHLRWFDVRFRKWVLPLTLTVVAGIAGRFALPEPGAVALAGCLIALYAIFYAGVLAQGLHDDDRELLRQLRALVVRPSSAPP